MIHGSGQAAQDMGLISEQIEDEYHACSQHVVVKTQQQGCPGKDQQQDGSGRGTCPGLFFRQLFKTCKSQKGPEKGAHDVLMGKLQCFSGCHQVKGDLADQGKEPHPF